MMNSAPPLEHLPIPQRLCASCHFLLADTESEICRVCESAPKAHISPERRIDATLAIVADVYEALSDEERGKIDGRQLSALMLVSRVRGMERAEEEVTGRPAKGVADIYDRLITPGENAAIAIIKVFQEALR